MSTVGMTQGLITEEELARARSLIGKIIRSPVYNEVATKDAVRHFADGIGDDNPLWRDETYASKTKYGSIIAPPCFLYSVYASAFGWGFPGVHGWHSGNDWEFFRVIRADDAITVTTRPTAVVEKDSTLAGRTILQYLESIYRNQRGEVIAKAKGWSVRAERKAVKGRGKLSSITRYKYTAEEIKRIEEAYDKEEIRGANPRYWEEVNVDDELTPVVKGPLNLTDMHAFIAGCIGSAVGGRGGAHKFGLQYRRRHPGWAYTAPETGVVDAPFQVHLDTSIAQDIGIPIAYDIGFQRICWLGHLLTNWMGDEGFLKRLYAELRRFNMLGDTTWCKGKVVKKYIEGEDHLVDIRVWGENQRGEVTMPGHATVVLPSTSVS